MLRKNVAGQFLYFAGVNATTGAALTGATFSVRRAIDGTFAAGGATITEDTGLGLYKAALTQADTNGNDLAFFFTATNAIPICINALTTSADPSTDTSQTGDSYARIGAPAGASVSADIAAIEAQTDDIGAAGAGLTALASATDLATVAGYLDTEIAAIKAKTDNLPAAPAAVGDIPTATQNADALLNRDMSAVSDTNARSPLNALRFLRNKWSVAAGTLTVKEEDDTTTAWTASISTDAAAVPVIGSDPA